MTPVNVELVDSPREYTPEYCMAVRSACAFQMDQVDRKVEKLDSRMFSLLLLGVGNLLTALGGVVGILILK